MTKHWPYLNHLDDREKAALASEDGMIEWLRGRRPHHCNDPSMLKWINERVVIHKAARERIINRGTQRARLAAERTEPPRPYHHQVRVAEEGNLDV